MTTAQDQLSDLTHRGQKTFARAFESWTETVQDCTAHLRNGHNGLPSTESLVNEFFDFADEVLRAQREVARSLLSAGSKVSEATQKVTDQAASEAHAAATKVTTHGEAAEAEVSDHGAAT